MKSLGRRGLSVRRIYRKVNKVVRQIHRRQLRRRVALAAPCRRANQQVPFSPHCLTSHDDMLMAICSAKSLNLAIDEALPWVFHDDGSLTAADKQLLLLQFPGCHLIERARADEFFGSGNASHLKSLAGARQRHTLLLKLTDVQVFARHERILYVDSDVLFFRRPVGLLDALANGKCNYFTKDVHTAYVAPLKIVEEITGVRPPERVNSGILVLTRADIALEKVAHEFLKVDRAKRPEWTLYNHLIEQTLVAILTTASSNGADHLPQEYDLRLERGVQGAICRHYVGVIRESFELEGLRTLVTEMEFLNRWRRFCRLPA